jgi:predicted flavoprotein YhiN
MADKIYDVIIIGGGASGMMAGVIAGRSEKKVLIIEKNKSLGEKLKITGGGRCNIFNRELDTRVLLKNYKDAEKYLYTPFSKFGVKETEEFFKNIGIEIKEEDRKRVFPKSERALDVFNALKKELEKNNVEIKTESQVEEIIFGEGQSRVDGIKIKNDETIYKAEKYILATGGYSHPETGSTGDGFVFLNSKIKIHKASPSLVPVTVENIWVKKLTGKTIENIKITFYVDGIKKKVLKYKNIPPLTPPKLGGEQKSRIENVLNISNHKNAVANNRIIFTHFGLSGPTILNNSKEISDWLKEGYVEVVFDLFPQYDEKEMDKYLLNIFEENKNVSLKNILNKIYPGNILGEIFLENLPEILDKKINDIRVPERKKILYLLKNLKVNINGLMGFDKAIIADGGVDIEEVNFENMSLKKIPNLHVTGDMLNINRPSGGYSLQLCWTTGFIAGSDV